MAAAYQLSGKVALVTGAARGIGLETARALVGRGASVVVVDLDPEAAESAAAQLHDSRAIGLAADVTDRRAVQQAVATAVDRFGGLDVVVANAGIASRAATFRAMATEGFERVVDVNLMGVVRTVDAALPEIVRRRGHVVVIASVYAFGNGDTEMVHRAIDADRVLTTVLATFPKPLQKRLQPAAAGEAIVRGIERRAPRIIRPRAWVVMSTLRGIVNPLLDLRMERDATMQAAVRELDARADEEQPTTA